MQAVARELLRRHVVSEHAARGALGQEAADEVEEVLLCSGDVLAAMQKGRELGGVMLVLDERVGFEHRFEALTGVAARLAPGARPLAVGCDDA